MAHHPSIEELALVELVVHESNFRHGQGDTTSVQREVLELSAEPTSPKTEAMSREVIVTIAVDMVALIFLTALQLVVNKFLTMPMANYPSALTIHSVFWLVPPSFVYGWVQWKRGKLGKAQVFFPTRFMLGLCFFLALGYLLCVYGVEYTPGPLQVLLNQCVIPISMVISYVWLGTRYRCQHYVGMVTVLLGILLAIGHELSSPRGLSAFELSWVGGYVLSWLPYAVLTVYLENIYQERPDLDCLVFNGVLNLLQLPFILPLAVPFSVYLGRPPVPASDFALQLYHGSLCLLGYDSEAGDDCWPWAPTLFVLNTALIFVMSIPFYSLSKHGGSNLVWLTSAVTTPLANLAFSLPFLPQHQPFTAQSVAALVVVSLGLLLYGYGSDLLRLCTHMGQRMPRPRRSSRFYKALEHSSASSLGQFSSSSSPPSLPSPSCSLHDTHAGLCMTDLSRRQRPV